jgi:hypothetical protein
VSVKIERPVQYEVAPVFTRSITSPVWETPAEACVWVPGPSTLAAGIVTYPATGGTWVRVHVESMPRIDTLNIVAMPVAGTTGQIKGVVDHVNWGGIQWQISVDGGAWTDTRRTILHQVDTMFTIAAPTGATVVQIRARRTGVIPDGPWKESATIQAAPTVGVPSLRWTPTPANPLQAQLSWAAVTGATSYVLEVLNGFAGVDKTVTRTPTQLSYTHTMPRVTYRQIYRVKAVFGAIESPWSNQVRVKAGQAEVAGLCPETYTFTETRHRDVDHVRDVHFPEVTGTRDVTKRRAFTKHLTITAANAILRNSHSLYVKAGSKQTITKVTWKVSATHSSMVIYNQRDLALSWDWLKTGDPDKVTYHSSAHSGGRDRSNGWTASRTGTWTAANGRIFMAARGSGWDTATGTHSNPLLYGTMTATGTETYVVKESYVVTPAHTIEEHYTVSEPYEFSEERVRDVPCITTPGIPASVW